MTLPFACTSCGRCCHDLRLTLSIDEALRWLARGGTVEILCDALPAAADFGPAEMAQYRARAFAARSGSLDLVVGLILVATFVGPCPNLQPDMRCGDYADRPNICRIYPAETLPGRQPMPADKRCPDEAWAATQPAMFDAHGRIVDGVTRSAVAAAGDANERDAPAKRRLADLLGIDLAALRHEGFAAFRRDPSRLHAALLEARETAGVAPTDRSWSVASPSARTSEMIVDAGATAVAPTETADRYYIPLAQ